MPSIRIKGQVHSTLDSDAISTNDDTLCLRGELPNSSANPRNTYSHTSNIQHSSSLPLLPHGLSDVPSPSSHTRFRLPRSASSRVYAHCINTSRNPQHSQPPPHPLSNPTTPTSNVDSATTSQHIEGALSDVRVQSHVDPSIAESSINTADDEDSHFSGHHHDDVVEHLDVIGIFIFKSFFHLNFITFYHRSTSWCCFKSHQCRKFHRNVSLH
jgi:hypothetical protein